MSVRPLTQDELLGSRIRRLVEEAASRGCYLAIEHMTDHPSSMPYDVWMEAERLEPVVDGPKGATLDSAVGLAIVFLNLPEKP